MSTSKSSKEFFLLYPYRVCVCGVSATRSEFDIKKAKKCETFFLLKTDFKGLKVCNKEQSSLTYISETLCVCSLFMRKFFAISSAIYGIPMFRCCSLFASLPFMLRNDDDNKIKETRTLFR